MREPGYDQDLKDRAKAEGLVLVTADLDGRPAKWLGRWTMQFACPVEMAKELFDYTIAFHKRLPVVGVPDTLEAE